MSEEISLKQNSRAAVLVKLETDPNVQVHVAKLELDEGLYEVVLHVFDETLQNFVAKRISLNIKATAPPFQSPAVSEPVL